MDSAGCRVQVTRGSFFFAATNQRVVHVPSLEVTINGNDDMVDGIESR